MSGRFIVVEGIDGAGKTTHLQFICARIQALKGAQPILTREPGGTDLAEQIRGLLLRQPMDGMTEALLAFAARRDHLEQLIGPALSQGKWVVCDRFTDSTRAYQGAGAGVDADLIEALALSVEEGRRPDRVYVFDAPAELAAQRRRARGEDADRFEQQNLEYFQRVREVYLQRARQYPNIYRVIDSSLGLNEIQHKLEIDLLSL